MKRTQNHILHILMNGFLVGKLEKLKDGSLSFVYDSTWIDTPGARPISLSLPLTEFFFKGDVVYNYFDNLLPDNPNLRKRIQTKYKITNNHPFDLLASIGKDCIGAIQIIEGEIPSFKKEINFQPLAKKEIALLLRDNQSNPLGMTDATDEFRISLAGAQEKAGFLYYQRKWGRPLKSTPTTHIFKLPIGFLQNEQIDLINSCENEWLCLKIAEAFGFPVANSEILQFEEIKVLAVERFDRKLVSDKSWIMRLPQEDMCQALGISPNLKYQAHGGPGIKEIMKLLRNSANPLGDRFIFFRAQILFWLLGAIDGHAKNFSIFIEPGGSYHLTPLYDIISAYPFRDKQKIKMAMALYGKNSHYDWYYIQRRHFLETAKAANYSVETAEVILNEMLLQVDTVIKKVSVQLPKGFPNYIAESIFKGMVTMQKRLIK